MTMQELLSKLQNIQIELDAIDLTKDESVSQINKMATKPISHTDEIIKDESFRGDALDATVKLYKKASQKVESYDPKEDKKRAIGDKKNRVDILAKAQARERVKSTIVGKYEELSRKQDVISKYKEKFDPEHLVKRQERKQNINKDKINANETRIREVADFKSRVDPELTEIRRQADLVDGLEKLEKQFKELEDAKADFNAEKVRPDADKDFIEQYQEDIKNRETQFKDNCTRITNLYHIKLDPNDLKNSIKTEKSMATQEIEDQNGNILDKLDGAEKKYGYTSGFEDYMRESLKKRLQLAIREEDFIDARTELEAENMNLDFENDKIAKNIETIHRGKEILEEGTLTELTEYVNEEPTEEEIQSVMESDSEIKAMIPVLTDKEMRQKVYESLTKDKKGKIHPILFLKSFGKKAQAQWREETYENDARAKAIEKIKNSREVEASDVTEKVSVVESKRQKFMDSLFTHVMGADNKTVEEMDKNVDKQPGKVLSEIYNDMEKDDDGSR